MVCETGFFPISVSSLFQKLQFKFDSESKDLYAFVFFFQWFWFQAPKTVRNRYRFR